MVDLILASLAWWFLPTDPSAPLVVTLWAITLAAFFLTNRQEQVIVGMVFLVEFAKWPLAATVYAGRFGQGSFLRELMTSEWTVNLTMSVGRTAIITATYALFRSIARFYLRAQAEEQDSRRRYQELVISAPTQSW